MRWIFSKKIGPNIRHIWKRHNFNVTIQRHDENQQQHSIEIKREPPLFAKLRGNGKPVFSLIKWKNDELLSDYVLFEESVKKCKVPWLTYKAMTAEEIRIYLAHYKAVQERKMSYKCPTSKKDVSTVSQLIYNEMCCGEGCRHCPYELQNCSEKQRKSLIWNGAYYV